MYAQWTDLKVGETILNLHSKRVAVITQIEDINTQFYRVYILNGDERWPEMMIGKNWVRIKWGQEPEKHTPATL